MAHWRFFSLPLRFCLGNRHILIARMKNMPKRNPDEMLLLSNKLLDLEMVINRLEHEIINILGTETGDPIISDQDFLRLKQLAFEISVLKKELKQKTLKSEMIKKSYFKSVSRKLDCHIRLKK